MMLQQPTETFAPTDGYHVAMCCPRCGSDGGLHHLSVEVYNRTEDAADVRCTVVSDESTTVCTKRNAVSCNPSLRRDGLAIRFWCELCSGAGADNYGDLVLTLAQHKGATLVRWS